jgi:hypothetical protein
MAGIKTFTDTSAASSTITGAVRISGGLGVAGAVHAATFHGNGSGLTTLNASNLSSGTVPSARVSGSYTGITGTGALNAGQITSGFGNINIGTSTFTGNGSGLTNISADTLDGINSTSFVRSDANDNVTGLLNISRTGEMLKISDTSASGSPYIGFYQGTTRRGYIQMVNGGTMRIASDQFSSRLDIGNGANGLTFTDGTTWTVWHSGNDGTGSGLDADLLDGQHGSYYYSPANAPDPTLTLSGDATGSATFTNLGNATLAVTVDRIDGVAFRNTNSSGPVNADTLDQAGHTYYTSGVSNFSGNATDGALYSQIYSTSWQHQIAGDYRSGRIAVRGKNNGTWQPWQSVYSDNYHPNADTWTTARTITLAGDLSGSVSINGSSNVTLTAAVADNSHNHSSSSGNFTVGGDLTVSGGQVTNVAVSTRDKYRVWNDGTYVIGMQTGFTFGGLTNDYAMTFQMSNTDGRGFWWGDASHTNAQGAMSLTTNGKLSVAHSIRLGYGESDTTVPGASYVLDVNGAFAATTKSFVIDHPTKPGMKLRHGSLEGPEDGVYVRGRLKGNVIELPDYWTGLVHEDSITVNLTAIGKGQDLWVEDIVDNKVIVGGENVNCFYTVFGTRKDVEAFDVEYEVE